MSCMGMIRYHPYESSQRHNNNCNDVNNFKNIQSLCKSNSCGNIKTSSQWSPINYKTEVLNGDKLSTMFPNTNVQLTDKFTENRESAASNYQSLTSCRKNKDSECMYVLYRYFEGDLKDEIESHFARALDKSSELNRATPPMCKRNFPASFWNSNYKPRTRSLPAINPYTAHPYNLINNFTKPFYSPLSKYQAKLSPNLESYLSTPSLKLDIGDSMFNYPGYNPSLPRQYGYSQPSLTSVMTPQAPFSNPQLQSPYNPMLFQSQNNIHNLATSAALAVNHFTRQYLEKRSLFLC